MMMKKLSDEDSKELYRLEIGNGYMIQAKAKEEGRVKLTESVPLQTHCSRPSRLQSQNSHQWWAPKSAPKGKSVGNCEDEETETSQNVPLGTIDLESFEVLSDHGDEVDVDESTYETTEMMPALPPDSAPNDTVEVTLEPSDAPRSQGPQASASSLKKATSWTSTEVDPSHCQTRVLVSHP